MAAPGANGLSIRDVSPSSIVLENADTQTHQIDVMLSSPSSQVIRVNVDIADNNSVLDTVSASGIGALTFLPGQLRPVEGSITFTLATRNVGQAIFDFSYHVIVFKLKKKFLQK